jgi:hypothetical protein
MALSLFISFSKTDYFENFYLVFYITYLFNMSNAEFYYNLYVKLYKDFENPQKLIDRVWKNMKKTHVSSIFFVRNPRLTILDLIKKFCIYFPKIKYEDYVYLDDLSIEDLGQLFLNNATFTIQTFSEETNLQKIQKTYILFYLFEICSVISFVILLKIKSYELYTKIEQSLYAPVFLNNHIDLFIEIIKRINILKKEHKKQSYDEINIKLLQKKYPSIAQPLQFIVSKYL